MDSEISDHQPLHFVLVPFMAQGHMIPMVDIARLLARRGVTITIVTTPYNGGRFEKVISRDVQGAGLAINMVTVNLPYQESGLREGCENLDLVGSFDEMKAFYRAANMLEERVEKIMKKMNPRPSCLIGDVNLPFTNDIAKKFKIPMVMFHGFCCFCLLCLHVVRKSGILRTIESENEYFQVPDFPDRVEFTRSQLPQAAYTYGNQSELMKKVIEADETLYGVIVNTFEELEPEYVKEYKKAKADKVWCIGPVSLCNKVGLDKAERGNKVDMDQGQCLKWLDSQDPGSVLYVCLGSLCNLPLAQLKELGLGLEESNRPFIWVVRDSDKYSKVKHWISDSGFEERIKGRGVLIKGWASQVLILSHPSVGGFLTHCGWNSTLEGITAGTPLLTWPLFGDQFCNEKLVVQILKAGVRARVEQPMKWGEEEQIGVLVYKEGIKKAVDELMGDSVEAEERRRRVKKLGDLANKALEEGGSSHHNIALFIQDIMHQVQSKT